jgi:hypothetical protein
LLPFFGSVSQEALTRSPSGCAQPNPRFGVSGSSVAPGACAAIHLVTRARTASISSFFGRVHAPNAGMSGSADGSDSSSGGFPPRFSPSACSSPRRSLTGGPADVGADDDAGCDAATGCVAGGLVVVVVVVLECAQAAIATTDRRRFMRPSLERVAQRQWPGTHPPFHARCAGTQT